MGVHPNPFGGKNRALGKNCAASALPAGARVEFKNGCYSGDGMAGWRTLAGNSTTFAGRCANGDKGVKDRYLGLRFIIQGQVHFGWARLNVSFKNGAFIGLVTGYADETIPNKAIITGKTKGTEEDGVEQLNPTSLTAPTREPATLGLLALGSPILSIWRREEFDAKQREPDTADSLCGGARSGKMKVEHKQFKERFL